METEKKSLRQNELEAAMAKGNTYGEEKYCAYCWACVHGEECFATVEHRTLNCLCVKAEERMQEDGGTRAMPRKRTK